MSEVVDLLQELVRIPSVNPQGDPGTPFTGEERVARFVGEYLSKLGADVDFQWVEKGRPNVIGRLKSRSSRRHVLLGPHLDTVSVSGMTIEPFGGVLRDGKLWGRGASDTKGPCAAMLVAMNLLFREKRCLESTDLWFAGLMGEESGNDGIAYLVDSDFFSKQGIRPDFGIAGEPTDLKIVHRHKGALWLKLRARGRSCHASCPEFGENAIVKIRRALDYLVDELPLAYAHLKDDVLGSSTFNVTTVRGGSKVNIIPDLCELEIDHRSLPQESHSEIIERIRNALPEFEIEKISGRPGLNTPSDDPYIQKLADVLQQQKSAAERCSFLTGAPWFADCSLMSKAGIPAIAFGPGSICQAHTKDEYIEVAELEKGVQAFYHFYRSLD